MQISVLLQKDGGWQPTTLEATTEEALPAGLEQLKEWVAYRVIGPTGGRSKVVKEEQTDLHTEAPPSATKPGAKPHVRREVLVQQTIETTSIELLSRPSEWSAPCWKAACSEATAAGINIEQILSGSEAGAETPLVSQKQLDQLLADTQAAQSQLYTNIMTRLAAKLLNEAENKQLQTALMAEGAAGLWDLASDRQRLQQSGLSGGSLRGLMVALRKPVLSADVQLPAACAVWHAAVMAKPRNRLIESDVMEVLLQIADSAYSRMQGPGLKHTITTRSYNPAGRQCSAKEYLTLLSSSLGALAVLAVDARARHHVLCNKARLKLLADVAGTPPQLFQQLAEQEQEQQSAQTNAPEQPAETAQTAEPAAAAPAPTATQTAVAPTVPAIAIPPLQHKKAGEQQQAEQATGNIILLDVSEQTSTGAGGASSDFNTNNNTPEVPISIPTALLRLKPNQLAAEVLATVLLRDPAARIAVLEGGNCRLLLSLTSAEDPYVQLCGAAAIASMANGAHHIDCWDSLSHKEPQLLWDLHASLQHLVQQTVQRLQHHNQQQSDLQAQSADIDGISSQELDEMLMDYGCLALWAVTSALAPVVSKQQVFSHLAAAAQLAQNCLQLHGAVNTSHTVVVCMAAVICTIAATPAAADAAADEALMSDPNTVVQALQPAIQHVLLLEASGPEVTVAKLLAAVTVMLLAGFERSNHKPPATAASPRSRLCPAPRLIITTEQEEQQVPSSDDTNPHPPFRGVFREALHSQGLLPAVLQLAMHGSSNGPADQSEASVLSLDFSHSAGKVRCSVPLCGTPVAEDGYGTKALIGQVVAAACQYFVAVNQPLPVESCAQVLDFLWDQMSHQTAAAAAATSTARPSSATTGMHTSKADASRVSMPAAQYYAATIWCLGQQEPLQQQLLLDGRWSQMLSWLVAPALQRLKKAVAAGNRHKASTDLSEGSPGGPAAAVTSVPRLQLQALQDSAQAPSSHRAGSSATSTWNSGASANSSSKRASDAAGTLHLCLQADFLLLQQEAKLRRLAAELPADLKAVYARGKSSYWAMEINAPSPADLSEPVKLGLSQLVDALDLPDSWAASLRLKLVALNSCWCLTCADKAMCAQLIELGLPQCTASNCQAARSICKGNAGRGNSQTDTAGLAKQLLVAAAGYVTAAVQDPAAVQGLGGLDMTTQLLVSLLTVCNSTSTPAGVDVVLLNTTLSSVAWLSNRKDAAASCCGSKVVAALLDILRLEKQAYRALDSLVRQQYMQLHNSQQQTQSPQSRPQQQEVSFQKGSTQSGSTKRPRSAGPRPAFPAEQPVSPSKQQADERIHLLPMSVLQAPLTALQQQDSWLQEWLQQQKRQHQAASAPSSPTASSRYGSVRAPPAKMPSPHSSCSPGRQPGATGRGRPSSPGRLGIAAGGSPQLSSRCGSARASNRESLSNRAGVPSSRSVTSNFTGPWDHDSESEDMLPYQPVQTPDGTEGMLALWALLNISTHRTGQVSVCKKGLYTIIRLVQECPDPQRTSVAAAILENLTNARENTAMIYRAELRLKHAALLRQAGIKRMLNNPTREKQAQVSSSSDFPAAAAGSDSNQQLQPQQEAEPGIPSGALSTGRSHQSMVQTARRTSKLELAAESGVLTAMLCTTYRGVPKSGIGSEEHRAGMLLSRASQIAGRPAVDTVKPPPGSARKSVVSGYSSSSGGYAAPPPREVFSSTSGGFGSAVADFIPAAAGMSTSRRGTPREGEGFFLDSTPAAAGTAAPAPAAANTAAAAAPAAAAPVPNAQEVKAAFMRWLQEQMPEAVGSTGAAAGTVPATPAAGRGTAAGDDRLQGLAEEADLSNKTTEDLEEDEWLEQQRVAQQLHEFYTARAAQGQMLRGQLASSLRASTSTLWSQPQRPSSPQGLGHDVHHLHAHVHELIRPQSAPPGGRRSPAVHHHDKLSSNTTAATPSSCKQASIIGHYSSRPVTPAGRTPSPRQCLSPAQHGHGSAGFSPKGSRSRPSSAAGVLNRGRSPSPGQGNRGGTDPWGPTVVAYKQLPGTIITKPWQTANQLLVAKPDDDVVQELAAAATAVLDGHLPSDASPGMLVASSQRKKTLERITQQYQPTRQQEPLPQQNWYIPPSQQSSEQHTELPVLEAAQQEPLELAPGTADYAEGCAAVHPADAPSMSGSFTTLAGQGSLGEVGQEDPPEDPPETADDAHGTAGQDRFPASGGSEATDEQQQPAEQADRLHVTWGTGVAGRTTDGGAIQSASAATGASLTELDRGAQVLKLDSDRRASVGDYSVDLYASTTAAGAIQEGAVLLDQPNTGYAVPHRGILRGKQYVPELRGTFSAAVADSVRRHKQERSVHSSSASKALNSLGAAASPGDDISASLARPITVMDATSEPTVKPVQMLVKGADDTTLPDRAFKFHLRDPPEDPALTMHVFEHVDGAQFCSSLYGHYLLPNGKLAHFFVPAAALKQGHTVTMPQPPTAPWGIADWLPDGLPPAPAAELLANYLQPGLAGVRLPLLRGLNWVPVPHLAPQPSRCTLLATRNAEGGLVLQPGPLRLKAIVSKAMEQREFRKPLSAKAAAARRAPSGTGAAAGQQRPASAAGGKSSPTQRPASAIKR